LSFSHIRYSPLFLVVRTRYETLLLEILVPPSIFSGLIDGEDNKGWIQSGPKNAGCVDLGQLCRTGTGCAHDIDMALSQTLVVCRSPGLPR
jgi:hypothetical protein